MATVHLYEGRRWVGWYNSPGSHTIAARFGRMANSRFWDGLFPGPNDSPAVSFGLAGKKGPQYTAALSGTTMPTWHLAYLAMKRIKELEVYEDVSEMRNTGPLDIAYLAMRPVNRDEPFKRKPLSSALLGFIPITASIVTCLTCALVVDWLSFFMILIGIISNGCASFVIGKGRLEITYMKKPALGAPPGHGILMGEDEVLVIKGEEADVNAITKGRFYLKMGSGQGDEEKSTARNYYHAIGLCSFLILLQFLLQLLLVPQGTLFGQIMFLISLCVSWGYNSYLTSLEKEKIQTDLLFETLGNPEMRRFRAGTRTTMAVFVCLLLFHGVERSSLEKDRVARFKILRSCLANDTLVWGRWMEKVVSQLMDIDAKAESLLPSLEEDAKDRALLDSDDSALLGVLLEDARVAFRGYFRVRDELPDDSSIPDRLGHASGSPQSAFSRGPVHHPYTYSPLSSVDPMDASSTHVSEC
ncbi:hypothetical protein OG21DRAFT_843597 [Imleria badia]|nr:hypothetical protein OG21DRAFT_843597 [Imleria badia]